eukprot:TRINITY_DN58964_c0_g1_i1.p1 TRINITY_DN58964_c0_g1~~TRINITY_DN58964_c0_g1_i1.p1  ORF type:complete len:408 (+),score=61.33 TRINITY_DN58964_c0_g1_i1:53-1225(+)
MATSHNPSSVRMAQSSVYKVEHQLSSPLMDIVRDINAELISRGLPDWLVNATDKDLKKRAESRGLYDDMMNVPGSCLFLAMLTPEQFNISAKPLLPLMRNQDDMIYISTTRCKSGKGVDNRRTNCLEALINELPPEDNLQKMLQCAWRIAYRAHHLVEDSEADQFVLTQRICSCSEPLQDDDWWMQKKRQLDKAYATSQQLEVEEDLQQDAQQLFESILPELKRYAKSGEVITYKLLAKLAGFDGHKGKTVKRLGTLWESHSRSLEEAAADESAAGSSSKPVQAKLAPAAEDLEDSPHSSVDEASVHKSLDRGAALWKRFANALASEGIALVDLPKGDELTEVMKELGFTAIQRVHLRKMLSQALARESVEAGRHTRKRKLAYVEDLDSP